MKGKVRECTNQNISPHDMDDGVEFEVLFGEGWLIQMT